MSESTLEDNALTRSFHRQDGVRGISASEDHLARIDHPMSEALCITNRTSN